MDEDLDHPRIVRQKLEKQTDELEIIDGLSRGDEASFTWLIGKYHNSMLRIAMLYVHDRTLAEEIVQETWMAKERLLQTFRDWKNDTGSET